MSSSFDSFRGILKHTKILKAPKHRLSTFGETRIHYFLLSDIKGFKDRCRLRQGVVHSEKPRIITPELFRNRFEGFGKMSQAFSKFLNSSYGDAWRGLEYKFKNENRSSHVENSNLKSLADQIDHRLTTEESHQSAILHGPDEGWQIALMKFTVDECMASFQSNLRDLDQHGFFDAPKKEGSGQRQVIEQLFRKAKNDPTAIPLLGSKLREFGMFKEYEDRFFGLLP